jgi:hypothetical protein
LPERRYRLKKMNCVASLSLSALTAHKLSKALSDPLKNGAASLGIARITKENGRLGAKLHLGPCDPHGACQRGVVGGERLWTIDRLAARV